MRTYRRVCSWVYEGLPLSAACKAHARIDAGGHSRRFWRLRVMSVKAGNLENAAHNLLRVVTCFVPRGGYATGTPVLRAGSINSGRGPLRRLCM
jgi:hypothetical protein